MTKHVILMHGRSIKPSQSEFVRLGKEAIAEGLRRAGYDQHATAFTNGAIKFSTAYYGDINNGILAAKSKKTASKLTAKDPDFGNAPCLDGALLQQAYDLTRLRQHFTKNEYAKVLNEASDWRFLDEAADMASLFGALFSAGLLNQQLIKGATADLYAYLTEHSIGSAVRDRLNSILKPAIENGDEICLLTHSMGCIVAYDVFWKYAHMQEYAGLRAKKNPVSLWLTFGNPLGEKGVRQNLLDGRYSNAEDKYPRKQVKDWLNIYAEDDFVAHVERVGPLFRHLKPNDLRNISDGKIYNCWTYHEVSSGKLISNPHDMYGYLMNEGLAKYLGQWL